MFLKENIETAILKKVVTLSVLLVRNKFLTGLENWLTEECDSN